MTCTKCIHQLVCAVYGPEHDDILSKGEECSEFMVTVVMCKDCEHWDNGYKFCKYYGLDCYGSSLFGENDFCSRGRRRTE